MEITTERIEQGEQVRKNAVNKSISEESKKNMDSEDGGDFEDNLVGLISSDGSSVELTSDSANSVNLKLSTDDTSRLGPELVNNDNVVGPKTKGDAIILLEPNPFDDDSSKVDPEFFGNGSLLDTKPTLSFLNSTFASYFNITIPVR